MMALVPLLKSAPADEPDAAAAKAADLAADSSAEALDKSWDGLRLLPALVPSFA